MFGGFFMFGDFSKYMIIFTVTIVITAFLGFLVGSFFDSMNSDMATLTGTIVILNATILLCTIMIIDSKKNK